MLEAGSACSICCQGRQRPQAAAAKQQLGNDSEPEAAPFPLPQPPAAWAQALNQTPTTQKRQYWQQMARLLMHVEQEGVLQPGQAAKALFLAQALPVGLRPSRTAAACWLVRTFVRAGGRAQSMALESCDVLGLQVWSGRGPAQYPGNLAGALMAVVALAGGSRLTSKAAAAAVRAAGVAACPASISKWRSRLMRHWRVSAGGLLAAGSACSCVLRASEACWHCHPAASAGTTACSRACMWVHASDGLACVVH